MAQYNGLPIYQIKVDESLDSNQGIDFISLVDHPAIEVNWVALSSEQKFYFDASKQMLYGPILIPNQPIYRFNAQMGEFYVSFPTNEIEKMVRKFQSQKKTVNLNYQHKENSQINNAVVQELWLTSKTDKSQDLGFNLPIGTAMAGVYIGDSKFWNEEVKSGNVRGFSIEGFLDMELKSIINNKMEETQKFAEAKTQDGGTLKSATDFTVGADVTYTGADGTEVPADGEFTLDNGQVIKCVAGKIEEIMDAPTPEGLGEQETAIIQKAVEPITSKMSSEIEVLRAEIKALTEKFSNTPAARPATEKKSDEPVKMSAMDKVRSLTNKK